MAFFANVRRLFDKGRESNRLDIRDMMSMSDKDLGREFRKRGEWNASEKGASINDTVDSVMSLTPFECGLILLMIAVGSCISITGAIVSFALVLVLMGATALVGSLSSILKRKHKYDEFDNLGHDDNSEYEILSNFCNVLDHSYYEKTSSLNKYRTNIIKAINRYHGYSTIKRLADSYSYLGPSFQSDRDYRYRYTDTDIGRMLKLIIPVVYLEQNTDFNVESFSELDHKLNLNNRLEEFNKTIDKRNDELNDEAIRQQEARIERDHQEKKLKTDGVVNKFMSFEKEAKKLKNNPEYARINDISRRLNERKDSLVRTVNEGNTEAVESE